jgi:hypothetical protein
MAILWLILWRKKVLWTSKNAGFGKDMLPIAAFLWVTLQRQKKARRSDA